jgi:hypothetical protein
MKFLPYEKMVFHSNLKEDEVKKKLVNVTEPIKGCRFQLVRFNSTSKYAGEINGSSFQINRIISYRNSFLPQIIGKIEPQISGCTIRVIMRLHLFVLVFLLVWLGIVGLVAVSMIIAAILFDSNNQLFFFPLGMFIFGCLLSILAFKLESSKSKKDLKTLFETENIVEE